MTNVVWDVYEDTEERQRKEVQDPLEHLQHRQLQQDTPEDEGFGYSGPDPFHTGRYACESVCVSCVCMCMFVCMNVYLYMYLYVFDYVCMCVLVCTFGCVLFASCARLNLCLCVYLLFIQSSPSTFIIQHDA